MWLIMLLIYIPKIASVEVPHAVWFKTILKFQNEYASSNIFITQSEASDDLRVSNNLLLMLRQLSEGNNFAMIARITDMPTTIHYYRTSKHRHLFVIILQSITDITIFSEFTRKVDLNSYPTLVLFTKNTSEFCHNPVGNQFNLNFDSKMLVKCEDSSIIQEWYSIHADTTKAINLYIWHPNFNGFEKLTSLGFYERRNSLDGLGIRVVNKEMFKFTGIAYEVFKVLSEAANFQIQITPYQKRTGIYNPETKRWSGLIGQLQNNEADVGFTRIGLSITLNRLEVIEFTKVLLISRSKFYIKKLSKSHSMPSMYYKAIGIKAVYCLLIVLTGSPIILTVVIAKQKQISYRRILYDNYLYVWRIFCINPSSAPSQNLSTKVACLSLLFTAYILYSVYSTLLVSYLTVFKPDMPFHSLQEFVDAKTHKIVSNNFNSLNEVLEISNDEMIRRLRTFFVDMSNVSDWFSEVSKQICDSDTKMSLFTHDLDVVDSKRPFPCELISFGNGLRYNKCLALAKGSPYKGLFDYYVQKMQDSGVLDVLIRRHHKSPIVAETGYKAVNLHSTLPIFGILGGGISLSLFIFVCEKLSLFIDKIRSEIRSR